MIRVALFTVFGLALLLVPFATAEPGDAYEEAVKAYEAGINETALVRRTQARARLAMSRDIRAMQTLANDYGKPEAPKDQVRYLIAHISSRYFTEAEWVEPYQTWLDRYTEPHDAWLWFHGRSVRAAHVPEDELVELVDPALCIFVRAAAIEAVAAAKRKAGVRVITDVLDDLPKKGLERGVLLASLAAVALSLKEYIGDEALLPPLVRLVEQIDDKATPEWAALAIGRYVSRLVDMPDVTLQTPFLISLLEGRSGPRSTDDDRYGRPTFMGVKASGNRICYVIDCSDSMLTPLTGKEKELLKVPVITGAETPKKNKKDGADIDWDNVRTRFDLAREYLKLSLSALSKDKSFAIVCFGTEAALLDGTKGMARATKGNVKKAVRALDGMKAGPATETRVHGTLMGDTNFHAALMSAFGVVSKGLTKDPEYVAPKGFDEGADTIYFLSDGRPTADNWPGEGPMSGPGGYRDPETGKRVEPPAGGGGGTGTAIHVGPYADGGFYLDGEIQRMNLFRKAEIHCIGIGEARKWQLAAIAKVGLGKVRMIGDEDEDEDEDEDDD